jgi:AraC-like DNA-binding protein
MDVLSAILGAVKLQGTLYFTTEFSPPWGVRVPALERVVRFHLITRGSLWVATAKNRDSTHLETGDLVLVPHGAEHTLADAPDTPCVATDQVVQQSGFTGRGALVYGGPDTGNPTRMVCGHFALDRNVDHPLLDRLPSLIVIRRDDYDEQSRLEGVFRFIAHEAAAAKPGSDAVIARLSEVLFIQALRLWASRASHENGLLAALSDAPLARSLELIHENPREPLTLDRLAERAGLSRTVFAERFRRTVGLPPMQYLSFWRIQCARRLLTETDLTLTAIAEQVGYESAPSLHRTFTRWVGEAPGSYRRKHRDAGRAL